jgi:hypothetical protein
MKYPLLIVLAVVVLGTGSTLAMTLNFDPSDRRR